LNLSYTTLYSLYLTPYYHLQALQNNLAQISFALTDYEASHQHFQLLQVYTSTIRPEYYDPDTAAVIIWFMSAFLSHTMFFSEPGIAAAA
jgi:hypothetical protein